MADKPKLIDTIGQFTTVPNSVIRMWPELGQEAFMLFVYLRYRSDENDECFPSYGRITKDTGIGAHQVAKAIRRLIELGLLERRKRFSQSSIYTLKPPQVRPIAAPPPISADSAQMELPTPSISADLTQPLVLNQQSNQTHFNYINTLGGGGENTPNLYTLYTDNIGMITTIMADVLRDAEKTYPASWFAPAFEIAVKNNKRNWAYISAILDRWQRDGFMSDSRPKRNGNGKPKTDIEAMIADAEARYAE